MEGYKIARMSFPDYETPTGKVVGGPYLGKKHISDSYFPGGFAAVDPKVAALYYAADFRFHKKTIDNYIHDGYIIITDRYIESSMGHQGGKLFDKEERLEFYKWIEKLDYELLEMPKPDLIIFLHMPAAQTIELSRGRVGEEQHENNPIHIKNAEKAYLELAELHNFKKVECVNKGKIRGMEDIQEDVYKAFNESL